MPIFTQPVARVPGQPYRDTDSALLLAGIAFVAGALAFARAMEMWKPFDLSLSAHVTAPLLQHEAFVVSLQSNFWPIASWYSSVVFPSLGLAGLVFAWANQERKGIKHLRGRQLFRGKQAHSAALKASKAMILQDEKGIEIIPGINISRAKEVQSVLVMGAQGGGKTVFINQLLLKILARGDRCLVFDPVKADYTGWLPMTGKALMLISNTDSRSLHWYLGYDIRNESDAQAFAAGLIESSGDDPMWANAARAVLVAILKKLIVDHGSNWSWDELAELCYWPLDDLKEVAETYYPPAAAAVADARSKTSQSIMINLHAFLSPVYHLAKVWRNIEGKKFSFKKWMDGGYPNHKNVIVQMNQSDAVTGAAMARAIVSLITTHIASLDFSEDRNRRIWLFMDEICQFGDLGSSIASTLEVGRSKGIACVWGLQDSAQVVKIYGSDELQKWTAMTGLKVFPQVQGAASQRFVVEQIGDREVSYLQRSVSGVGAKVSLSDQWSAPTRATVILESELELFGKRKNGIEALFLGLGSNALALTIPFPNITKLRKPHVPWPALQKIASNPIMAPVRSGDIWSEKSAVVEQSSPVQASSLEDYDMGFELGQLDLLQLQIHANPKIELETNPDSVLCEAETESLVHHELEMVEEATGLHGVTGVLEVLHALPEASKETHHLRPGQPKKRKMRSDRRREFQDEL